SRDVPARRPRRAATPTTPTTPHPIGWSPHVTRNSWPRPSTAESTAAELPTSSAVRPGERRCSTPAETGFGRERNCALDESSSAQFRGEREATQPAQSVQMGRSEEHTSELQSRFDLVCRLLLEKKN